VPNIKPDLRILRYHGVSRKVINSLRKFYQVDNDLLPIFIKINSVNSNMVQMFSYELVRFEKTAFFSNKMRATTAKM